MKKVFSLLVLFIILIRAFFYNSDFSTIKKNNLNNEIQYLNADYDEDYSNINLVEKFDNVFKGRIDSYIGTSQYNGNGTDIPYTFFKVNVLEKIRGKLKKDITIKFYGGYDLDGNLILLKNMQYPIIEKSYYFYCNQSNLKFEDDGRTIDYSYTISMEYNIKEKLQYDEILHEKENTNLFLYSQSISNISPTGIIGGGETLPSNTTFDKAWEIDINSPLETNVNILPQHNKYYKFTVSTIEYITIFSTGTVDSVVKIYDSNKKLLMSNDDVTTNITEYGYGITSGKNFFLNFYANKNELYYIQVSLYSQQSTGSFILNVYKDNWYKTTNINSLFWKYDGVDDKDKKVDYKIKSKFLDEINYGLKIWNDMDIISFKPDTSSTTNNITISDYTDKENNAPVAITTYRVILDMTGKYNLAYFNTMTRDERIKTILHEFGHVLGLDEFNNMESDINIMVQGIRSQTKLGPADIAAYRARWKK